MGSGVANQDKGYNCTGATWYGPYIGECYLTQSEDTLTIRWDVADETPDSYSTSGHHRWGIDDDGTTLGGAYYYDTGLRNWCNNTDANEGTYGDYYETTMTWDEFHNSSNSRNNLLFRGW